ncbi:MAG TPA: DNA recombination protein RmuC [Gemmatimonadales bacterium]
MDVVVVIAAAWTALLLGGAVAWLVARRRYGARITRAEARASAAETRAADAAARMEERSRAAAERSSTTEQVDRRLRETFQALSADALRHNNESFLQLARTQLGELHRATTTDLETRQRSITELVAPIRDALAKVDGKLHQVELARVGAYESLIEQVRAMAETQRELSVRTGGLVSALRSPTVRGRWGEIQLRRVCEMAGMLDHCDFVEQASVDTADGRLRPDLLVRLPGGKVIIVDAKAPLQAYLDAVEGATDDQTRETRLRDHARQVRDHVGKLSAKSYWGQFEETPEFVVMFLPGETFFSTALQHDPGLIEYGVDQRVIPASPTTLIALLRSVAYGWQQERIARNAEEISAAGRELYERVRVFAGHHAELRRSLGRAVESYNRSVGSLERSVLPQARRFRDLGATSAAEIPDPGEIETALRTIQAPELVPPTPGTPELAARAGTGIEEA